MANHQTFGEFTNAKGLAIRPSFDRQQGLVLLRWNTLPARGGLAERQEPAQRVPERRQRLVVCLRHPGLVGLGYIRHHPSLSLRFHMPIHHVRL